ncbi:hypothetical protein TRAPUB_2135 [Trametes pubescens]|uniref:Uncharacterized protein n=1 Tax=Trametes pubescens TaxID=154538 RepID=A0A1M2VHC6_TRAPU|nr:hypothetical protein TRAPUB_2135 [Trametes pubescens]
MWRVFSKSSVNRYTPLSARLKLFRKVTEAILQSAAIYSMASVTLIATLFISVDIGFVVCIGVFPSLLRMARSSAEDATRLASHTLNGRVDNCRGVIPPSHPMNVQLPIHPIPPATFHLSTLKFPEDAHATDSSNASTNSVKPVELLPRNMSSHAEDRDLEGTPGEIALGVLDIRA